MVPTIVKEFQTSLKEKNLTGHQSKKELHHFIKKQQDMRYRKWIIK